MAEQALVDALAQIAALTQRMQVQDAAYQAQLHETAQIRAAVTNLANAPAPAAPAPAAVQPVRDNLAVDTRVLGKPESFDGTTGWRDWSLVFRSYTAACSTHLGRLMAAAEPADAPVLCAALTPVEAAASNQLHYMLVMITKGGALTRVVNAGSGEGLEAWRTLVQYHEPTSATRAAGLLQELLNFDFDGDIHEKLVKFERDIARYEAMGEEFPANIRIGTLIRRLPESGLKQHILLNSTRLMTWTDVKLEIENVRRAQMASASSPHPMDLDALGKAKGKGGKEKGAGAPDKLPTSPCPHCGKPGHWGRDCWWKNTPPEQRPGQQSQHAGKGKDGKKGKGKGKKGKSKDLSGVTCWSCGQKGHRADKCPKKKGLHAVNEQEPTQAPELHGLFVCPLNQWPAEASAPKSSSETLSFGIDSGAAVSIIPDDVCQGHPLAQDTASGKAYYSAGGHPIYDEGRRELWVQVGDAVRGMRPRVGKVKKCLLSVYDLCSHGHRVVFDIGVDGVDRSYAEHKDTKEKLHFELKNRVWEMHAAVLPAGRRPPELDLCPFGRRGASS